MTGFLFGAIGFIAFASGVLVVTSRNIVRAALWLVVVMVSLLVQGWSLTTAARWLHVALPIRPNGVTGWVRAADVQLVPHRVEVPLAHAAPPDGPRLGRAARRVRSSSRVAIHREVEVWLSIWILLLVVFAPVIKCPGVALMRPMTG